MMRFLERTALNMKLNHGNDLKDMLILVPNKRTGLFLEKELIAIFPQPFMLPKIQPIEEFINEYSKYAEIDLLELNLKLYRIFNRKLPIYETFDQFYFWGEMLIRDFNDLDKNLVNAKEIFQLMKDEKEIDKQFQYLQPEQIDVIKRFWSSFNPPDYRGNQQTFIDTWNILYPVYDQLGNELRAEQKAYPGMMFKEVAEGVSATKIQIPFSTICTVGFHILSKSEELVFDHLKKNKQGKFFWDVDEYYLSTGNNRRQHEAGKFLKHYVNRYPNSIEPSNFIESSPEIHFVSCTKNNGQIFSMKNIFENNQIAYDKKTAIVMPDESMLIPVLQAMTRENEPINVTLGYNLKNAGITGIIDSWLDVFKYKKGQKYFYKPIIKLLNNAYIKTIIPEETDRFENYVVQNNLIYIFDDDLTDFPEISNLVRMDSSNTQGALKNIRKLVERIYYHFFDIESKNGTQIFETEVLFQALKAINKLEDAVSQNELSIQPETLKKLLNKYLQSVSVNFSGEPVTGLQIMGLLESRNLDFENVFILNANEGILPASITTGSYIPYHLRLGFGLPTYSNNDSMYAYYIYRLLHQAKNVYFLYNNVSDELSRAEPSRYMVQLELESGLKCNHIQQKIHFTTPQYAPIVVEKTSEIFKELERYYHPEQNSVLTPSALNVYLDCRLKFYFRYIVNLHEPDTLADEIDPATFGNLLHNTMQNIYSLFIERESKDILTTEDMDSLYALLDEAIGHAMKTEFSPANHSRPLELVGDNFIIQQILRQYALNILKLDGQQLPRKVPLMEEKYSFIYKHKENIRLGGRIDRIDELAEVVRVIDYKTGKTENKNEFKDILQLFSRDNKNRKEYIFQIFLYSFLLQQYVYPNKDVIPELLFVRESYQQDFESAVYYKPEKIKQRVHSMIPFMESFKIELDKLLDDFLDPHIPYSQTDNHKKCENCPYAGICGRNI